MAWVWLLAAGLCEIAWAIGLKYSEGFTRWRPAVWTVAVMILSFILLANAMRSLPVGTAYAVWTGIGAAGTAVWGMLLFDEPRDPARVLCLLLIVAGIAGLKIVSPE
ncbi:MAG TPA: quaternary ammonium compound efflux SMR transporter SugE [bacterium]|nr:quaternary ammonium compound efflux SMR transporter SugE [Candidatus Omnitrophota bacterium]HOL93211.1 quaternary ammonium compound efflux SMR transporter SugE [bacterium]